MRSISVSLNFSFVVFTPLYFEYEEGILRCFHYSYLNRPMYKCPQDIELHLDCIGVQKFSRFPLILPLCGENCQNESVSQQSGHRQLYQPFGVSCEMRQVY